MHVTHTRMIILHMFMSIMCYADMIVALKHPQLHLHNQQQLSKSPPDE